MNAPGMKILKIFLACLICIGVIIGIVYLMQWIL